MTAFALGSEVHELLADPKNPDLVKKVQKYTEDFAAVKGIFEGLYIATPETHVLTHTSQDAVGMTTRTGDSLKSFQKTILAEQKLTNLGIMKSPGTGSMILSMYYPIFENGTCIGYVGAGVFASRLMDALLDLDIKGLPNSEYVFLNAQTGVYLYHEDAALLNTKTKDAGYLEIIRGMQSNDSTEAGTYSYVDENGVEQLVVYKYLKDRDWVFMVRDNASEVYSAVGTVRFIVGAVCAAVAAVIILVTLLILHRESRELMVVESAIRNLGNMDLHADRELESFYGRKDEIGLISQTVHHVCGCLWKTIDDIGRILGEMAGGNISVDVAKNEDYYIGDFKVLAESLKTIRMNLTGVMRDISYIANQVDEEADQVSTRVQTLSEGTVEQSRSVDGLVSNVTEITSQIQKSAVRCADASELVDKANGYAIETDEKMTELKEATRNIDESSTKIGSIIKTIDEIAFQTNILALNAAVEAERAGSAGKGFSVVAEEVRSLASKSADAAQNTVELIGSSMEASKSGTASTNHAVSSMQVINECIQSIKVLMDEIVSASVQQSEMIASVETGIREISQVIQTNSEAAEESALVSKELSDQARTLNHLIGQFHIE